ncbi:hypothetical protein RJ55_04606 [Drechmeria coniospora]|nr:hypothetical protein RJ55_04606 [Drechmeria coniospora]
MDSDSARQRRLAIILRQFLSGDREMKSSQDAALFFEAADNVCTERSPAILVERVVSSPKGVDVIRSAVRSNISPDFISNTTVSFLRHLLDPQVKALYSGLFLKQLIGPILSPSTFWASLLATFQDDKLDEQGVETFANLCLAVVSSDVPGLDVPFRQVEELLSRNTLLESPSHRVRTVAYRIQKALQLRRFGRVEDVDSGAGGRHDNDFPNFRQISIQPTSDEIESTEEPFLPLAVEVFNNSTADKEQAYLDWLFRLLMEDMVSQLRDDIAVAQGRKTANRKPTVLKFLELSEAGHSDFLKARPFAIKMAFEQGLSFPSSARVQSDREKYLKNNPNILRHGSFGALCMGTRIIAMGILLRDLSLLSKRPPVAVVQFTDGDHLRRALTALLESKIDSLQFCIVDTAVFAYEPILQRLKETLDFPLRKAILSPDDEDNAYAPPPRLRDAINKLKNVSKYDGDVDLSLYVPMMTSIRVGGAQLNSLINGLENSLAQIQGPPGTGKSFLGALILSFIIGLTNHKVLVISYTNHALDQFLEDLLDIGLSENDMVRLGSKATERTKPLGLNNCTSSGDSYFDSSTRWLIGRLNRQKAEAATLLHDSLGRLSDSHINTRDILDYLELDHPDTSFWDAFQLSNEDEDFIVVGKAGKVLGPRDLYNRWMGGETLHGLGSLAAHVDDHCMFVWELPAESRRKLHARWTRKIAEDHIAGHMELAESHARHQTELNEAYNSRSQSILLGKRVIGCTTTGAAMNHAILRKVKPDVVLVEEAGEILEAHVVSALGPSVKQLILIGDHKQLRPKVGSYRLTVEMGEGFDLNESLFERLIKHGHKFTSLTEQHRSHPDISHFTRLLAYPHLENSPETLKRDKVRGLQSRVIFAHHEKPEDMSEGPNADEGPRSGMSKRNTYEAEMVLKTVKYLGQQGYKSKDIVVITPYLGQLLLLKSTLSHEHDAVLNDLDSFELVRAGLMTSAAGSVDKAPLRISTIDNYQGEERDIVIVSLTRSNPNGDIGFLHSRERLVVLMSRARNGIILFGNMQTLMNSKRGGELWKELFQAMKKRNCIFDGLPVCCERHPERQSLLKSPQDFDRDCPNGGCLSPCGVLLPCGKHKCGRSCHRLENHSQVICHELVEETCERGHKVTVTCSLTERECKRCLKEDENVRRRVLRDFELEQKRQKQQDSYALELQELDNEIDHHRRTIRLDTERQEQLEKLNQKKRQLESLEQRSCAPWNVNESKKKHTRSQVKGCTPPSAQLGSPANEEGQTDGFASAAREEWETHKSTNGDKNAALDELMGLIGLESIKEEFLSTKFNVDIKVRQNVPLKDERLGCCMLGNPGTGKTTVARIWARFLMTIGAIPGDVFEETTGAKLANGGVRDCESLLEKLKADGGGVLFVDEAYQLSSGNSPGGTAVIDFLLGEIENLRGKVVFVFAGYEKEMEAFLAHNPGLPSRLPLLMKFDDYDDTELLRILHDRIVRKYSGRMTAEDGLDGLYMRIASRRLGRGRGKKGFGNARAMENVLAMIEKRQSKRLRAAQLNGEAQDEYRFGKEDIIGPEPSAAARRSEAWKRLNAMIGLEKVKEELRTLVESLSTNYQRELAEEPLIDFALNRVFIGPPGTGKTTVAKLYGQILAELGFLSNGDVVVKNPSDFVGSVLGQSETLTKGILSSTVGKVLVIDEAYSLYDGGSDGSTSNLYKSAIIDTLVAEVQNVPGEDRCVIMLGYEEQMDTMFRNVNPGLSRRFSVDSPFVFEDFDDKQLQLILDLKLKNSGFAAASKAKQVALGVLRRERNRPNFGNGGAVDNLLSRAKISFQERASKKKGTKNLLEAVDFDKYFDRAERTYTNVAKLFEGEVGREEIIAFLEELQERAMLLNEMKMDPGDEIPFSFLFRGPPGTGKTTTARKMGKVYYDMGLLATANVTECSATDLIGKFDGHTGPKVQQLLDRALGQVLFIDEAYRLAGGGFAQEAVDELVDSVTKPRYQGKLIIILAGYDEEINRLLSINPGMSSGFPESINFQPLRAEDCVKLLTSLLANKKEEMRLKSEKTLDVSCLEYPSESFGAAMVGEFESLAKVAGWGNARDVKQLAKVMFRRVKLSGTIATLEEEHVLGEMSAMLKDRTSREKSKVSSVSLRGPSQAALGRTPQLAGTTAATPAQADIEARPEANDAIVTTRPDPSDGDQSQVQGSCEEVRDAGVSDEIWNQLQLDRLEEQRLELEFEKLKKAQASAGAAARDRIVRQVLAEEEKRRREEANKARLQALGVCPVGYQWIKQQGGYRCAGGSHWMADDALGAMS